MIDGPGSRLTGSGKTAFLDNNRNLEAFYMYRSQGQDQGMDFNDWVNVSQSIGAIGATIDRKRAEQKQDVEAERKRQTEEQAAQAFNYFVENPKALDFDNPEKQTAQQSAIGEVAGVPAERPRLPIEDFAPEAIAKGRVAALQYWTDKKSLSAENLRMVQEKAKVDFKAFEKGVSSAATLLATGNEDAARQAYMTAYNDYYPDGHKMEIDGQGNVTLISPFGVKKEIGPADWEKIINETLASPALNETAFAQAAQMSTRAMQVKNMQAFDKPEILYSQKTGKPYYAYQQRNLKTGEPSYIVGDRPFGAPGFQALPAGEVDGLGLITEDAVKFKEDRQKFGSDMATDQAQRDYYNDRGEAVLSKGGTSGKMSQAEKEAIKKDDKAWAAYEKNQDAIAEFKYMEPYAALDPDLQAEVDKQALSLTQRRFKDFSPDGGGGAIAEASGASPPKAKTKEEAKAKAESNYFSALKSYPEDAADIKKQFKDEFGYLPEDREVRPEPSIEPVIPSEPEKGAGAIAEASAAPSSQQAKLEPEVEDLTGAVVDQSGIIWVSPSGKQPVRKMVKPNMTVFNNKFLNPKYLEYIELLKRAGLALPKEKIPNLPVAKNL